jgi:hypothetical protein
MDEETNKQMNIITPNPFIFVLKDLCYKYSVATEQMNVSHSINFQCTHQGRRVCLPVIIWGSVELDGVGRLWSGLW